MNALHDLYAAKFFPNLVPNNTNQRIFSYDLLGDMLFVRFFPESEKDGAAYLVSLDHLLTGRVEIPKIHSYGEVETTNGIYSYVSEYAVSGRPIIWNEDAAERVGRDLRRWHFVPTETFLTRIDKSFYNAKIGAFQSITDVKTFARLMCAYRAIIDDDLFTDPVVSHMDLSRTNIYLDKESSKLSWIDLEYVSVRPRMADLAQAILYIFLQHIYDNIEPGIEIDYDPRPTLSFDVHQIVERLLDAYEFPDDKTRRALLANWVFFEFLMHVSFFLHTGMRKVRHLPPILDKGANPKVILSIFDKLMAVVEKYMYIGDGFEALKSARKILISSFIYPVGPNAPTENN
jgi:hypothetical protein